MDVKKYLPISNEHADKLSDANPLALSFVGDGVHTLFVRAVMMERNPYRNDELHRLTSEYVCAPAQAEDAKKLYPLLTKEERQIFNKGKNGKINTIPKHATIYQYQLATALEAVIGYLYLSGSNERLCELFDILYRDKLSENSNSDTETTD